jgi:hypothetical protein
MSVYKYNKKLIGVPHTSNKILKNSIHNNNILNINTMYVDNDEDINDVNINEHEYLLKEKNKYIKYSSFENENKRKENNYCVKEIFREFIFLIGCIDKIN